MVPDGQLLVWPEVGHSPQLERPDELIRLLVASARRSLVMRLRTWFWRLWRPKRPLALPGPGVEDGPHMPVRYEPGVAQK